MEKQAAPADSAADEQRGAPAAQQPPAAVEGQLLQAEPEAEPEPARRTVRRGRGGSGDSQQQQAIQQEAAPAPAVPAEVPRKRKQGTIQVVQASKKQKGGALVKGGGAADKAAAEVPVRRGLRTSARTSQRAA